MKTKLLLAASLLILFIIACNTNNKQSVSDVAGSKIIELKDETLKPALFQNGNDGKEQKIPVGNRQQSLTDSGVSPFPIKTLSNPDWDKKIIKTATLKLEVQDFKNYNETVHKTVKQFGGYIAQEEQNLSEEKSENIISIKVPVDQFESMLNQLPGGDQKVLERKINTEDVTGEVVDTRSRLEAKKQMRLKYLEFLKQSKNMEEVLQVQNEINHIQEEIESAAGRVEFLSHQSTFSTINLTFFQPLPGYKPTDPSPSFLTRVSLAFKTGAAWIAELFIGLISIWPLLLVIFTGIIIWKKMKPSKFIQPGKTAVS